jgi:hypothetical protein
MPASTYLQNKLLNHVLKNTAYTPPTTVYVGLFTSDPTIAGSGTEVSGGSYARQSVAFGTVASGTTENSADLLYPVATANWGTVTHIGIYDASTSGNMLYFGALASSKTINSQDQFKISAGNLDVTLT